jgi:hypothetical protein
MLPGTRNQAILGHVTLTLKFYNLAEPQISYPTHKSVGGFSEAMCRATGMWKPVKIIALSCSLPVFRSILGEVDTVNSLPYSNPKPITIVDH